MARPVAENIGVDGRSFHRGRQAILAENPNVTTRILDSAATLLVGKSNLPPRAIDQILEGKVLGKEKQKPPKSEAITQDSPHEESTVFDPTPKDTSIPLTPYTLGILTGRSVSGYDDGSADPDTDYQILQEAEATSTTSPDVIGHLFPEPQSESPIQDAVGPRQPIKDPLKTTDFGKIAENKRRVAAIMADLHGNSDTPIPAQRDNPKPTLQAGIDLVGVAEGIAEQSFQIKPLQSVKLGRRVQKHAEFRNVKDMYKIALEKLHIPPKRVENRIDRLMQATRQEAKLVWEVMHYYQVSRQIGIKNTAREEMLMRAFDIIANYPNRTLPARDLASIALMIVHGAPPPREGTTIYQKPH